MFHLSIVILAVVIISFALNPSIKLNNQDIYGEWSGSVEGTNIVFNLYDRNECSITFESTDKYEMLKGICEINSNKIPYSMSIKNIETKPYSLYTLIKKTNDDTIEITNFSSKWRLREISFVNQNTIVLKKI